MKTSIFSTITLMLLVSIVNSAMQASPPLEEEDTVIIWDSADTTDTKTNEHKHYKDYMHACYHHRKGNAHEAFKAYKRILDKQHPPEIYDGFVRLLFETGQFGAIVTLYEQKKVSFDHKFKENIDVRLMIAQAFLYVEKGNQAEEQLAQLHEQYKNNEIIAYYMAITKLKNNPTQALTFIDKCLSNPAFQHKYFLFNFLASKIYLQMHQPEKALQAIDKSLKQFPHFDQGILFKAMLLEQKGNINEAINEYQHFLTLAGHNEGIEKQLVHMLFTQKRYAEAGQQLRAMGGTSPEYYYDLALIDLNAGKKHEALAHIEQALTASPHFTKAKLLKIEIVLALNEQDKACSIMEQWLIEEPSNLAIVNLALMLQKAQISKEQLITLFTRVIEQQQSMLLHSALADLYLETHHHTKAYDHYTKALALADNEALKVKINYQLAYIHLKENEKVKAVATLKKITKTCLYPPACNLLAYLYAQDSQHLPEALKLIDHALQQKPDRHDFTYTKGLVLLKLKNKKEAISTLKKALNYDPTNEKIQQHLNEALAQ